jgi:uncharacterized protein (TIGR00369 family)
MSTSAGEMPSSDRLDHWRRLVHMYETAPVNRDFEPRMELGEGTARLRMPVKDSSFHAGGSLHGAVYFKMLDDAAVFAIYSIEREVFVVTTSFTTYILGPVSAGALEATGMLLSQSGRLFVARSELRCGDEIVAHGNGVFTRSRVPLSSIPTYGSPGG